MQIIRSSDRARGRSRGRSQLGRSILVLGCVMAATACSERTPLPLDADDLEPTASLIASSIHPAEGKQGERLQVWIFGEGFDEESSAAWHRDGVADPLIVVEHVTVVSATEMRVVISIDLAADVDAYDVVLRNRKKGIGTEARLQAAFQVTPYTAILLPGGEITDLYRPFLTIDDQGDIFGSRREHGSAPARATRWHLDAIGNVTGPVDLGTLPAPYDVADQTVNASNGHGTVIGIAGRGDHSVGWVWADGEMKRLPPVPWAPQGHSVPLAVNRKGVIVGQVVSSATEESGAIWMPPYDAPPILLPRLVGYQLNSARAISDDGVIIGWARGYGRPDVSVRWEIDEDGHFQGPVVLEETSNLLLSMANVDLDLVGAHQSIEGLAALLYRPRAPHRTLLGALNGHTVSWARGVTPRAADGSVLVVGQSSDRMGAYTGRAVVWRVDASGAVAGPEDLGLPNAFAGTPPSPEAYSTAFTINRQGWIAGWSRDAQGRLFSTVWVPDEEHEE
jgi:hypothetical protein